MPELKEVTDGITRTARDAAYVVVGIGVLGLQRAQVRRQELAARLQEPAASFEERFEDARGELTKQLKAVDDALEQVIDRLETSLEPIEERLPGQARELVRELHTRSREAREQVRTIVLGPPGAAA